MCFSGGTQKVEQTNKTVLSPEQKKIIEGGLNLAQPIVDGNVPNLPTIGGFNPAQAYAQGSILNKAAPGGALDETTQNLGSAQNFLLGDVLDVNKNPALQGAIDAAINPIRDEFTRVISPGINHESIGTGAFTSFGGTKNILANDLANSAYMRQVGDTSSKLISDAYSQGLEAMTKGVALAPQTQRSMLFPETAIGAVGDVQDIRSRQQSQQQFEQEMLPFNLGLQLMGTAGAMPGGGSTGTVTGAQPQANPIQQLLGTALSAFAFL